MEWFRWVPTGSTHQATGKKSRYHHSTVGHREKSDTKLCIGSQRKVDSFSEVHLDVRHVDGEAADPFCSFHVADEVKDSVRVSVFIVIP